MVSMEGAKVVGLAVAKTVRQQGAATAQLLRTLPLSGSVVCRVGQAVEAMEFRRLPQEPDTLVHDPQQSGSSP